MLTLTDRYRLLFTCVTLYSLQHNEAGNLTIQSWRWCESNYSHNSEKKFNTLAFTAWTKCHA